MNVYSMWALGFLFGLLGGSFRAYYGWSSHKYEVIVLRRKGKRKSDKFCMRYFVSTVIFGGISGALIAGLLTISPAVISLPIPFLATIFFLAGIGGSDLVEALYWRLSHIIQLWFTEILGKILKAEISNTLNGRFKKLIKEVIKESQREKNKNQDKEPR